MSWPDIGVKPYFEDESVQIYHADCRDILRLMPKVDLVLTDPVWPNACPELVGASNPYGLFAEVAAMLTRVTARAVIQLGCNSDPRLLASMPPELPFFRVCWLEYARPHYMGHLLYSSDVAYAFGAFKAPTHVGAHVIPGRMMDHSSNGQYPGHPCPRKPAHVEWLVKWFSAEGDVILDPFLGSGTTAWVAKATGRKAIGIEIEERYCQIAAKRMSQSVMKLEV